MSNISNNGQLTFFDEKYQPRFQAYLDQGNSLDEFKEKTFLYILWINKKWREFMQEKKIRIDSSLNFLHGKDFDDWLKTKTNS
jgi:hypothetical protein